MGLRGHYSGARYSDDYEYLYGALHDVHLAKTVAGKLDAEGRRRLEEAGWAYTNPFTMESDPFVLIDEQLKSVLHATACGLKGEVFEMIVTQISELEPVHRGALDPYGRTILSDPAIEADGEFYDQILVFLHGPRAKVLRLARSIQHIRESGSFEPVFGMDRMPPVYLREPVTLSEEETNTYFAASAENHALMFVVPGEPSMMGMVMEDHLIPLLLQAWGGQPCTRNRKPSNS